MTRYEFIDNLKNNLTGLNQNVVNSKIKYYNDYIDTEVNKGRSEADVINELGDPRLIAKTIKDVEDVNNDENVSSNTTDNNDRDSFNKRYNEGDTRYSGNRTSPFGMPYVYSTSGIGCVIAGLVFFIIVYGILQFVGRVTVGSVRLMFTSPILFLAIVAIIYYIFSRKQ